jgi:hypothetical protein
MLIRNNMAESKKEIDLSSKIILRSVRGKVGNVIKIQPCVDPETGEYADCVKRVDSNNDMILSEKEKNDPNRVYFIKETATFDVVDGTTFDLTDTKQRFIWEAIRHCPLIAPEYYAKDKNGNSLINGTPGDYTLKDYLNRNPRRFGIAELYVERPGVEANRRVSRKKLKHDAETYIYNDERGYDGRVLKTKLLGHRMDGMADADVTDYLLQVAEKDPQKIINLYTGGDSAVRLLFIEARDKKVIRYKDKLYMYADILLGATDDAAILYLKDPKNANVLKLIKEETFPELMGKKEK